MEKKGWKVLAEQGAGNHRPRKEAIDHISLFIYENKVLSKTKESLFKIDMICGGMNSLSN